jgi:TolB-like protein/Flp pilus assembly protein TadD
VVFAFGDYRLDRDRRELRRGSELIGLEPQVFDLLVYLIRERHRVVGKNELLQAVWSGRIVSDSALTTRVHAVRRALGDDGATQRLIRTFTRKGVRFVGDVREIPEPPAPTAGNAGTDTSAPYLRQTLCDVPSIAVLPFANLSHDRRLDDFVHGLAEETTTALCRIPWLRVISPRSGVVFKKRAPDAERAGRSLETRYRLQGSMRKNGECARIVARLTEAESGVHLWSDRLDGSLEDPLGFQDKVASSIAGAIEPVLQTFEAARTLRLPMSDLTPYYAYLRAHAMRSAAARHVPAALALLENAIARDPDYGPALGLAANCYMRLCMDGISKNPAADAGKGAEYAWRALEVAPDDPDVLANVAQPLAYAGEDIRRSVGLMDRALTLNPNFARGWYMKGILNCWAGDLDVAIEEIETARRLSPRARFGTALTAIGNALVFGERFEEAIEKLQLAILEDPSFPPNYRLLAICYAHLGRLDAARAAIARLPRTAPLILPNLARSYRAMARVPEHHKLALSGVRRAVGEKA